MRLFSPSDSKMDAARKAFCDAQQIFSTQRFYRFGLSYKQVVVCEHEESATRACEGGDREFDFRPSGHLLKPLLPLKERDTLVSNLRNPEVIPTSS